jgi:multiple sugar transport system permease protein
MNSKYKVGSLVMRFLVYLLIFFLLLLIIVPIWLLIVNSTRSTTEIQQGISIIPSSHLIENWRLLKSKGLNLPQGFANSIFLAVSSTLITVYFSLLTAYALVVYEFKARKMFSNFIVLLVMIPTQFAIVGFYRYMSKLGLADNYIALILPLIANAGAVFFGKQYLESMIIQDLIDAARIDGASELGIFHRIMIPLAVPGAATMGIFAFVASWNNFFNAFIMITSIEKYTLPMMVQTLRGDVYRTEYGAIYLGLAITIVPMIIVYAIFSRFIVSGIAMGAVKE